MALLPFPPLACSKNMGQRAVEQMEEGKGIEPLRRGRRHHGFQDR